MKRFTAIICSW